MLHLFIINPAAGKHDRTRHLCAAIEKVCMKEGLRHGIRISREPGDCTAIARSVAETGEPVRLYACGGDGTLNEVAAGAAGFPNAAVTHVPWGSGNDFLKLFQNPKLFRDIDALVQGDDTNIDMIQANGDYAVNICSVGLDARIGTQVAAYKRLPLVSGGLAYLLSAAVEVVRGITGRYTVQVNGETLQGTYTLICVCNGRYYGGGFHPVPEADPQDGQLDVLLVGPVTRLQVLKVIGLYKAGRYSELPQLVRHIRTNEITVSCDREMAVNLDGELRTTKSVHFAAQPGALRFFHPASSPLLQPVNLK